MGSNEDIVKIPFKYRWVLYSHDPDNRDYSKTSYTRHGDMNTLQQFWTIINGVPPESWKANMFFFMRSGYQPKWDSPENENGGAWSKKIETNDVYTIFIDLMLNCVLDRIVSEYQNTIAGVTISPKGPFSIIKIWNTNSNIQDNRHLNPNMYNFKIASDVTYTPHKSRPK